MKEVVKFQINTPVEVALQVEAGERVQGRYGEQVMYSLLDNRVMYVPPYVEQRFQDLAIGVGEPLLLCKQQVKQGNRNRTEWSVKRAPQQTQAWANGTTAADSAVPATTFGLHPGGPQREIEIVAVNREATPPESQTASLAREEGAGNGAAKRKEQPSANSTALMA